MVNFDYSKLPTVMVIDIEKGKIVDYLFYLPEIYNQAYWGETPFKFRSNFLVRKEDNSILVSFAIDTLIRVYDERGKLLRTHPTSSKYFSSIQPFMKKIPKSESEIGADFNDRDGEYALTNPDFNFLLHDKINNVYFRLVYIRPTIEQYKSGSTVPHSSIIILDEEFNKIGETYFNGGIYRPDIFFLNDKGLHIARQDKYSRDENHLTFDILQVVEKTK